MGIDDMIDKAKEALSEHGDKLEDGVDKAAEFIKTKTDDEGDVKVDEIADKAKDLIPDK